MVTFDLLDFGLRMALEAGHLLATFPTDRHIMRSKSSSFDIVTEADYLVQELIVSEISKAFPQHHVVSEEAGEDEPCEGYTWYVDPIDGTVNFLHGVPSFAVCLALCHNGQPRVGVVYAPLMNELFWAERGRGAFCNGKALHVSPIGSLDQALIATGFPYERTPGSDNNLTEFSRLVPFVQDVRRLGSAALELAYVAAGRFDGYWEFYTEPWDTMAGQLMVLEAGGQTSTVRPGDKPSGSSGLLATNGRIHGALRGLLSQERRGTESCSGDTT